MAVEQDALRKAKDKEVGTARQAADKDMSTLKGRWEN